MCIEINKLSQEFYSTLESLMLLLDYSYSPLNTPSDDMISRELGKLHYLYVKDLGL